MEYDIVGYPVLDSTNDEAARLGRAGAAEGTVVVADRQRHGRGQGGRVWESPAGKNIYASVLLRPSLPPQEVQWLTLVAGIAIAEAIDSVLDEDSARTTVPTARIKWPNDVWLAGKKCAGILNEASVRGAQVEQVVVGFGVNVNAAAHDFSPGLRGLATSLHLVTGRSFDCTHVLHTILARFTARYADFLAHGFAPLRGDYERRALDSLSVLY